jgi:hypothetical protein
MKLSTIKNSIKSQRLITSAIRDMLWQNLSSLTFNAPRLARAQMNAHRSDGAQKVVDQFNKKSANFWALFAMADSRGMQYDVEDEIMKLTNKTPKMSSDAELEKLAISSGFPIERIKADEKKAYMKKMAMVDEKFKVALAAVMDGEFQGIEDTETMDERITIKAEKLSDLADNLQEWLISWDKPDYAEMIIVKKDIATIQKFVEIEENQDETTEELNFTGETSMQEKAYMRIVNG